MLIISTEKKAYTWNYKRGLNNLKNAAITVLIIGMYLYISNMEYTELIGRV